MCASCKKPKERIELSKYKYADERGDRWEGKVCPSCMRLKRGRKRLKDPIPCKTCFNLFVRSSGSQERCGPCQELEVKKRRKATSKKAHQKNYIPRSKVNTLCITCGAEFEKNRNQRYCSAACRPKKPYEYKKLDHPERKCLRCGTNFKPKSKKGQYCKATCTPSHRNQKLYRKDLRRCKYQKISEFYKKEMAAIYNARPDDRRVAHIIPLEGENVSGLHVPWNLEYVPT